MKLFMEEIENKKYGIKVSGPIPFHIATSYAPTNLWILKDSGLDTEYGIQTHNFLFRKVIAVMEVTTNVEGHELHGQVVTCANGEYGKLSNLLISLGDGESEFYWKQLDNEFEENLTGEHVYLIDLDDLRQSKGFNNLSVEECFSELLINSSMEYELRKYRYVDPRNGHIMDADEHTPADA